MNEVPAHASQSQVPEPAQATHITGRQSLATLLPPSNTDSRALRCAARPESSSGEGEDGLPAPELSTMRIGVQSLGGHEEPLTERRLVDGSAEGGEKAVADSRRRASAAA
eukprot:CAMPEP_0172041456 /NCGR_PEP_ID=MMETSP1041-20130122/25071_1 /TAXON_ID=464988 /ORGANISM="Hemiselmis andersenii, Strain CCMP439" /LENGTH=109 /DNA_ID=CAMNT_0012699481 /DNA_START=420 /DNA_END=749 /DNA_ORIENTATION=-